MSVLLLRHMVSLEASGPAILFSFVNPLHCPSLCFPSLVVITYVAAVSEMGISLQVPFLTLPSAHAANACLSLFCVSGFLPDTTGTVNWTDNFPAVRDISSQWERQSPMQINKVPLVVVFILM